MEQDELKKEKQMSFLGHLEELRWRLVRSAIAILIIATVLFIYTDPIIKHVYIAMSHTDFATYRFFCWLSDVLNLKDGLCATDIPIDIQSIEMTQQFATNMYFAIVGGIIIAFPFIFYQIWSFIRPGLKEKEAKITRGIVFYASLLFMLGILFGYFLVSPLAVQFFGGYKLTEEISNNFTINSYMSMITTTTFFSGLFFELPVVIFLLTKMGIVNPEILKKYRKHALVFILIISAVITPPDIISQILVSLPVLGLYEIGILVSKSVTKGKANTPT